MEEKIGFLGRNISQILFIIFGLYGFLLVMGAIGKNLDENLRILGGFASIIIGLIALSSSKKSN